MLDLVKQETERIESRFLEPACGDGNFLAEILRRKLEVVTNKYKKSQLEFERYSVLTVSSIYGIDILYDNVLTCRERLYEIFNQLYTMQYKEKCKDNCREAVHFIISRNIMHGDALTLRTPDEKKEPIIFSEWSAVNGSMIKRRDFKFQTLLDHEKNKELPLFSDAGEDVYIPLPFKEFPLTHFLKIDEYDAD